MEKCICCSTNTVNAYTRVCLDCDSRLVTPPFCEKCGTDFKNEPLPSGKASSIAGRIRECPNCLFSFYLPTPLAECLWSGKPTEFDEASAEWAFYIAWTFHMSSYGGHAAAIDCDSEEAFEQFQENYEVTPDHWGEVYWPDDRFELPISLFTNFSSDPQALYMDYQVDADEQLVTIELTPADDAIPGIASQDAAQAFGHSMGAFIAAQTSQKWSQIGGAINALFSDPDCLN